MSLRTSWYKISVHKCILHLPDFGISFDDTRGYFWGYFACVWVIKGMSISGQPRVSLRTTLNTKAFTKSILTFLHLGLSLVTWGIRGYLGVLVGIWA